MFTALEAERQAQLPEPDEWFEDARATLDSLAARGRRTEIRVQQLEDRVDGLESRSQA